MVKDPELEAAITAFWEYALKYNSVRRAGFLVNAEYGTTRAAKEWLRTGKLEIYCGTFEGIPDFCPAYVSRENWKKIQDRKNLIKRPRLGMCTFSRGSSPARVAATHSKQHISHTQMTGASNTMRIAVITGATIQDAHTAPAYQRRKQKSICLSIYAK